MPLNDPHIRLITCTLITFWQIYPSMGVRNGISCSAVMYADDLILPPSFSEIQTSSSNLMREICQLLSSCSMLSCSKIISCTFPGRQHGKCHFCTDIVLWFFTTFEKISLQRIERGFFVWGLTDPSAPWRAIFAPHVQNSDQVDS